MKKFFSVFLLLQLCLSAFAQGENVGILPIGNEDNPVIHRAPMVLPTVLYSDNTVTISHNYPIDLLQIIIRDEDGDIIYNNVVSFIPPTLTLPLPTEVDEEKYSIELLYGDWHLIGYF